VPSDTGSLSVLFPFFCRPVPACLARASVLRSVTDAITKGLPGWLAQPEGEVLLAKHGFLPGKLDRGAMAYPIVC